MLEDILNIGLQQIGLNKLQTGLAKPIRDAGAFLSKIDRVGQAFFSPPAPANPYARQNVLQEMQRRGDPLLTVDWIGIIQDPPGASLSPQIEWSYIDEIQASNVRINGAPTFRNGLMKKYGSGYEVDGANLKIYTDTTGKAFNFVNSWVRSVRRRDGQ